MHGLLMSVRSAGLWLRRKKSDTLCPWSFLDIRQVKQKQCPGSKCKLLGQRSLSSPFTPVLPVSPLYSALSIEAAWNPSWEGLLCSGKQPSNWNGKGRARARESLCIAWGCGRAVQCCWKTTGQRCGSGMSRQSLTHPSWCLSQELS